MCARELHGAARLRHVMDAPERLQRGVVERLHAERDAVDAGGAIAAETLRLDAAGIGLQRDLGIGRDVPQSRDRIEHRADRAGLHQRGRAAAEEDAGDGAARRQRRRNAPSSRAKAAAKRAWSGGCMADMAS